MIGEAGPVESPPQPVPPGAQEATPAQYAFLVGLTALAVVLAIVVRAYRPSTVSGPARVQPGRPAWPLAVVVAGGFFVWIVGSLAYSWVIVFTRVPRDALQSLTPAEVMALFTPADMALLATVAPMAALACTVGADLILGRWTLAWLGMGVDRRMLRGVLLGLLASIIIIPLMLWAAAALDTIYKLVNYQHPTEHDLLRVMKQNVHPAVRWLLIAGAVVVAPLFEEVLFRGHIQTVLRSFFLWLSGRRIGTTPTGFDVITPQGASVQVAAGGLPPFPASYASAMRTSPGQPYASTPLPGDGAPSGYGTSPPGGPSPGSPPPGHGAPSRYASPGAFGPVYPPPVVADPSADAPQMVPPSQPPSADLAVRPDPPAVWQGWLAIILTSMAFAAVHDQWTWPIIFVLSLMIGYAYERTGSLWTAITIHAMFNLSQTLLFLLAR